MNRPKMDPVDRAKQFLPFDALKGFREALEEKERNLVPPGELSVEPAEPENCYGVGNYPKNS